MSDLHKRFTPKFFYIKQTSRYLYVGQTTKRNVFRYKGSGVKWANHLKKEGIKSPETIVWVWCESPEDFQKCLDYYVPSDYVVSAVWANIAEETPWDGNTLEHQSSSALSRWGDPEKREEGIQQLASLRTKEHQSNAGKLGGAKGKGQTKDSHPGRARCGGAETTNNLRTTCYVCGLIGNPGNIGRWHNDKCKKKEHVR